LFRLDQANQISRYDQPYRVAMVYYLNMIQSINQTDRSFLELPKILTLVAPSLVGPPISLK